MQGGTAFMYYGEELGMKGAGKDENKRVGMYWSNDADSEGMCVGPADADPVKMTYPALDEQAEDPYSIYNYIRQLLKLRAAYPAIARGENIFIESSSDKNICVLEKSYEGEELLIVINTSGEKRSLDISSIKLGSKNGASLETGGILQTGEEAPVCSAGKIDIPAYSTIILK